MLNFSEFYVFIRNLSRRYHNLVEIALNDFFWKISDRHGGPGGYDRYAHNAGASNNLGLAAQLLAKPEALTTALTTLASLSSLGNLGGGLLAGLTGSGGGAGSGHVTGVHRRSGGGYGGGSRSRDDDRSRDSKRSKFAPYWFIYLNLDLKIEFFLFHLFTISIYV